MQIVKVTYADGRHLEIAALEEFSAYGCGVALPEYLIS